MSNTLPAGPYETVSHPSGMQIPYYVIPFDKRGQCIAPATRRHLVDAVRGGRYSHIFFFSHGWNNDWTRATNAYREFLDGFMAMRQERGLPLPDGYKPLLVGVFWPSTALVWGEDETGPAMAAGGDPDALDAAVADEMDALRQLADELPPAAAAELFDLAQRDELDEDQARRLLRIGEPFWAGSDDELGAEPLDLDAMLEAGRPTAEEAPPSFDDFGVQGGGPTGPEAAGLGKLLPRKFIRLFTVYQMKDRAGVVGTFGVGPLLRDLAATGARVHLIGHSFGAKIVLAATAAGGDDLRVESMLLLQPAVSHLCFADHIPKVDRPGAYHQVPSRVRQPILSTFSRHDNALAKAFHLAVRRKVDLGEEAPRAAAAGFPEPPSAYAALGGFGPRGAGEELIEMPGPGQAYSLDAAVPVYGLRGDLLISGHGDVRNPATFWALHHQVSAAVDAP